MWRSVALELALASLRPCAMASWSSLLLVRNSVPAAPFARCPLLRGVRQKVLYTTWQAVTPLLLGSEPINLQRQGLSGRGHEGTF
jgi:hypothetical protein